MAIDVNFNFTFSPFRIEMAQTPDAGTMAALEEIRVLVTTILEKIMSTIQELENLKAAVAAENTVIDSGITLITGLKEKLDQLVADNTDYASLKASVEELSTEVGSKTQVLADAIAANTPADPGSSTE